MAMSNVDVESGEGSSFAWRRWFRKSAALIPRFFLTPWWRPSNLG
jgi:hypothetical protein